MSAGFTFPSDDIRKFEHIGTHPVATNLTIANALRFQELVGYLTQY